MAYAWAQTDSASLKDSAQPHHIAVFLPLYLDSAFDAGGQYRYDKAFPKFLAPAVEFYEGMQLAIDSLQKEGMKMDVHIYDTRSASQPLASVLQGSDFAPVDLVIGHVSINEVQPLARAAAQKNIPFLNVNLPNDAGITNNPDYVILNSTLYTHCAGLYKFMQRNYALTPITVLRKKGAQEDRLQRYFEEIGKSTSGVPLKLKFVLVDGAVTPSQLIHYLDSNTNSTFLVSSLDGSFAASVCQQLASLRNVYPSTVIGMPTWETMDFSGEQYHNLDIVYSTPFHIDPADRLATTIADSFKVKYYTRPSDLVYRGYETLYHFAHLLQLHNKNLGSSLSDNQFTIFTPFDIEPVLNKSTMTLDYFENKKLFFVKKANGVVENVQTNDPVHR